MSAARELPTLVDVADVVAALGLSPAQVRRLVARGELVGYRFGRRVRIEEESVRDYAARCRVHVPKLVPRSAPTSKGRTSSSARAAQRGTRVADPSPAEGSASTPQTAPKPSASSPSSSPAEPLDPWQRLRLKHRSRKS